MEARQIERAELDEDVLGQRGQQCARVAHAGNPGRGADVDPDAGRSQTADQGDPRARRGCSGLETVELLLIDGVERNLNPCLLARCCEQIDVPRDRGALRHDTYRAAHPEQLGQERTGDAVAGLGRWDSRRSVVR